MVAAKRAEEVVKDDAIDFPPPPPGLPRPPYEKETIAMQKIWRGAMARVRLTSISRYIKITNAANSSIAIRSIKTKMLRSRADAVTFMPPKPVRLMHGR